MSTLKNQVLLLKKYVQKCSSCFDFSIIINNNINGCLNKRNFSTNHKLKLQKNFYNALEVPPNATHSDIKSAYYKLSMLYHPDRNEGCEKSAKKFRDIVEAYEVLGNFKLRKMYDRGFVHTPGKLTFYDEERGNDPAEVKETDDEQTKFYKQRLKQERSKSSEERIIRNQIYDFDEWTKAHYGGTFARNYKARTKHKFQVHRNEQKGFDIKIELVVVGIFVFSALFLYYLYEESKHDQPVTKKSA